MQSRRPSKLIAAMRVLTGRAEIAAAGKPKRQTHAGREPGFDGPRRTLALRADSFRVEVDSDGLFEEFLASRRLSDATKKKYRTHYGEFREWLAANAPGVPAALARRAHIIRFLAHLVRDPRPPSQARRGREAPLSPSAQRSYLGCFSGYYRYCVLLELRPDDPTMGIPRPASKPRPGKTLSRAEVRMILDAPGAERCRVQAYLLHFGLARSRSVRRLRWVSIDFENNEITFEDAKGERPYTIPLHPELKAALLRWRSVQRREGRRWPAIAAALSDPETAFVLLTRNGRPLSHSTLAKQYKWRARRAGVRLHPEGAQVNAENTSEVSPHWARRTGGTELRRRVDIAAAAEILHHKSLDTTRNHYAFASSEEQRKAVGKLSY